jgi:hypothetical protein
VTPLIVAPVVVVVAAVTELAPRATSLALTADELAPIATAPVLVTLVR